MVKSSLWTQLCRAGFITYLLVGKNIVCEVEVAKLNEAALALLSGFYLFYFDYPKMEEIGFNILQYYVF